MGTWRNRGPNLAVIVEVWVEPDQTLPSSHEVDKHGALWVLRGEKDVEFEAAVGIGRV